MKSCITTLALLTALFSTPTAALEITVTCDGLLGAYANGQTMTHDLDLGLPGNAVISDVILHLEGTSVPGLYYDAMDPDQTEYEFWGQQSPYFDDTSPFVYGFTDADAPVWSRDVAWNAIGGDVHWEFLVGGSTTLSNQFIGPSWIGFPVFVRSLTSEVTVAELTVTYLLEVPTEPRTWSEVKTLWR